MNGNYIHLTYLPDDQYFDWRIHYSGPQKGPYGNRVIHLTGAEMESVLEQRNAMMPAKPEEPERPQTYWNGQPTHAYKCTVRVGKGPQTWWCAPLEGEVRMAVMVEYGDKPHLLDDEDGSAWYKVTVGHGGPRWPSRSLPINSEVLEVLD